jgi:phage tail-like protein
MDANGLRFWSLADAAHWRRDGDPPAVEYDHDRRTLTLASERVDPDWPDHLGEALSRLERVPQTIDRYGTRAYWDPASRQIRATGALPTAISIFAATAGQTVTDLALGYDGVLYVALEGTVVLVDRRERWAPVVLAQDGFTAWRLAADPAGGVWVLDRVHRALAHVRGLPARVTPAGSYAPSVVRPCNENPDPPHLVVHDATWPASEQAVAFACSVEGRLLLLTWPGGSADACGRLLDAEGQFGAPVALRGARHPYSVAWLSASRIAVLLAGAPGASVGEAPVYVVEAAGLQSAEDDTTTSHPEGDYYPLPHHAGGPFVHGIGQIPRYATADGTAPLVRLSLPAYRKSGEASGARRFDSGRADTVWHRLYIEATVPPHCGVRILLAATDEDESPAPDSGDWYEHRIGQPAGPDGRGDVPQASWMPMRSELPFHDGLLACESVAGRSGLFSVLVQRAGRRVRSLKGRYLSIRVILTGNGRATPEIAAVRAYGSRFSYLNRYLPELYREQVFGPDADRRGRATPADFLERFLDNFEGILTPLEDRIASAHLLTDPERTPPEALEWLASWIGLTFDPVYPEHRRRALLQATPELYRSRGTLRGLLRALETATGGRVSGGEIVILEDFRLRRTVATILGADLADETDPLLAGIVSSGNSFVGDTLVLGDEHRREFLALFAADLPATVKEDAAIARLFDDLAHRITVLVHQEVEPQDFGLIRRIVDLETPAHVQSRLVPATYSFLVGLASLVGVDTYLGRRAERGPVRVDSSRLGVRDFVQRPASLDPRLGGGRPDPAIAEGERPRAILSAPDRMPFGETFTLDGSASRATPPRVIARYDWMKTR